MGKHAGDLLDLIQAKVRVDPDSGCHLWTGIRTDKGYGLIQPPGGKLQLVHRLAYALTVGPIPDGLELDHRCHTDDPTCNDGHDCPHRACVNPAHLEPVTHRENILRGNSPAAINARKTHCIRGHEFLPGSYYVMRCGGRQCRACRAITRRAWRQRRRAEAMAARAVAA